MADRFFQGYIYQLQNNIPRVFGVINNSEIVSCSDQDLISKKIPFNISLETKRNNSLFTKGENTYKIFYHNNLVTFAIFVEGTDDTAQTYANILGVCFSGMKSYFQEKYDRQSFYKNLLLENILAEDINVRASFLKIPLNKSRVVFLLRFSHINSNWNLYELTNSLDSSDNYEIFKMTDTDAIIIAQVRPNTPTDTLLNFAKTISQLCEKIFLTTPTIGIGSITTDIHTISESYKESLYVLALLYLFESKTQIISYNKLDIKRLIYHLPLPVCKKYLEEVFIKGDFNSFEPETLETINIFFSNDLNVSETARQLFIHRNTLMYRLDKVKRLTGLDIKKFDQAIIFKLAMLVHKHLQHKE